MIDTMYSFLGVFRDTLNTMHSLNEGQQQSVCVLGACHYYLKFIQCVLMYSSLMITGGPGT